MPKPILVNQSPQPANPSKEAHERLDITKYPPAPRPSPPSAPVPFVQHVHQQMSLLEGEITRLEAQIEDRRYQLQHLTAYLAIAVQEKA